MVREATPGDAAKGNTKAMVDERMDRSVETFLNSGDPYAKTIAEFVDRVNRPFCHLLAEFGRDGRNIEEVYQSFLVSNLNMMIELMLVTTAEHATRIEQAQDIYDRLSRAVPGAMEWARDKVLIGAPLTEDPTSTAH